MALFKKNKEDRDLKTILEERSVMIKHEKKEKERSKKVKEKKEKANKERGKRITGASKIMKKGFSKGVSVFHAADKTISKKRKPMAEEFSLDQ